MASQLPPNTAPAGYRCPTCQGPVFPSPNQAGPVATSLREKLSTVNWARAGLGLPLIEEVESVDETASNDVTDYRDWSAVNSSSDHLSDTSEITPQTGFVYNSAPHSTAQHGANGGMSQDHTVHIGENTGDTVSINAVSTPRKVYDTRDVARSTDTLIDFDDDKYRRRPTLSWLARILRNRSGSKTQTVSRTQRYMVILIIGILGFLTLILLMSKFGRASADNDPNLDPMFNPHIRLGKE